MQVQKETLLQEECQCRGEERLLQAQHPMPSRRYMSWDCSNHV
jgi:hypothetical protein